MLEVVSQAGISEVILLFVLLFVIPVTAFLVMRLRRYENQFGSLATGKKKKKKKDSEVKVKKTEAPSIPPDVFPYQSKTFITPPERTCLTALAEAVGGDVMVYVKVALWSLVQSTDKNPGYFERLAGKSVDFLVCDASTGKPFTAVCFEPGKDVPRGPVDEMIKICKAAGLYLVFLPMADSYDAKTLKKLLNIPEFDM